ncbi:MAG: ParB/RepB/Spo0J family partition protein [Ruminococcus sp.]|nr:ParB/RepB/Spo0J family partition protein [Ruminococcus sp.]
MKMIRRDSELPIELLKPHPKNPRKDVGDVTELAESIKANGIFQPLTVLSGDCIDGYTVVIGHRRLAAAKLAGLKKVPCNVAEMTEQEQISTMLLENMQRNDLTVYEQAQGFQMMLDLGETEQTIAEKTGFSKTTVKHRLKLLELDPEKFKKSQEKGVTLDDYIQLEKIHDKKLRNEVLGDIGTSNFLWKVQNAVNKEKTAKNKQAWKEYLDSILTEVEYDFYGRERLSTHLSTTYPLTDKQKSEIEKIIEIQKETCPNKPEVYYMTDSYGYAYIVGGKVENTTQQTQNNKYRSDQELYNRRKAKIEPVEMQALELRENFIRSYNGERKQLELLICELLTSPDIMNYWEIEYEDLARRLGLDAVVDEQEDDDYDAPCVRLCNSYKYNEIVGKKPQKVILYLMACCYEGGNNTVVHDYFGKYKKNGSLERWYRILGRLGYQISDAEKALLDGTHECFEEEDPEE